MKIEKYDTDNPLTITVVKVHNFLNDLKPRIKELAGKDPFMKRRVTRREREQRRF